MKVQRRAIKKMKTQNKIGKRHRFIIFAEAQYLRKTETQIHFVSGPNRELLDLEKFLNQFHVTLS